MLVVLTPDRVAEYRRTVRAVAAWAVRQHDIAGVAVVGSWARGRARMDSDVDLVVLTDDMKRYVSDSSWVTAAVGQRADLVRTQSWGPLIERRVVLPSALEVEFGFVPTSWARPDPVDPGTAGVVSRGCLPLVDADGVFARLVAVVAAT